MIRSKPKRMKKCATPGGGGGPFPLAPAHCIWLLARQDIVAFIETS